MVYWPTMKRSPTGPVAIVASLLAVATGGISPAAAQVNAEALRSTIRDNPRFLSVEGALAGRTGNTRTLTFSGGLFGALTHDDHLFFSRLSADYGEAANVTTVARWMVHTRYNFRITELVAFEALAQVQHDRFRRLAIRDLYGAGLRFNIVREKELEVFAGTTYIFEHELLESREGSPGENEVWNRSSNYVGVNTRISPLVDASSVTYFQPRFDRPSDFRIMSETFCSFTITKLLSARVSGSVWVDSDPPPRVRTYDVEIKNSLVLRLQ